MTTEPDLGAPPGVQLVCRCESRPPNEFIAEGGCANFDQQHLDSRQEGATELAVEGFSRQLVLGDNLDLEELDAEHSAGVLTIRIPVSERAKPRKIKVRSESGTKQDSISEQ